MKCIILCAGIQRRYNSEKSKLLTPIGGRPLFSYLMDTILERFLQSEIEIVVNPLQVDFLNYVELSFPKIPLIIDHNSGSGTASSLLCTFPWSEEGVFVTEGSIYYTSELIDLLLQHFENKKSGSSIFCVTNRPTVVSTHRSIRQNSNFIIDSIENNTSFPKFRNIGAYVLTPEIISFLNKYGTHNLIDAIQVFQTENGSVEGALYTGPLLHIADLKELDSWHTYFNSTLI